jgi:hypothetical protein
MFAQKDGYDASAIDAELARMRDLADMNDVDDNFRAKYQYALQESSEIAGKHAELKILIAGN